MSEHGLSIWTLYDHPADFPGEWVARRWVIAKGVYSHTDDMVADADLNVVRRHVFADLERRGMSPVYLPRSPGDDPVIKGVWL